MANPFAVQDKFTQKTQDLNPECKEGSIPIMLLWGITGIKTYPLIKTMQVLHTLDKPLCFLPMKVTIDRYADYD